MFQAVLKLGFFLGLAARAADPPNAVRDPHSVRWVVVMVSGDLGEGRAYPPAGARLARVSVPSKRRWDVRSGRSLIAVDRHSGKRSPAIHAERREQP
jgi:hypothetical protein